MGMEAPEAIRSELLGKEELLWVGRPDPAVMLAPFDTVLIPVSLLWCGCAFLWEASLLGFFGSERAPLTLAVAGLPMGLAGLYLVLGRYLFKAFKKRRTWYAVTSLRVLVVERLHRRRVTSGFFGTLPPITRIQGGPGRASLVFGALHFPGAFMLNSGLDLFPKEGAGMVNFFDLEDADTVQSLVEGRRPGAS
jgi:hypothetical protein